MKNSWIIWIIIVLIIVVSGLMIFQKTDRCSMPKPIEIGNCKPLYGWYYNVSSNSCEPISGCSIEGEVPFSTSTECKSLCVKSS